MNIRKFVADALVFNVLSAFFVFSAPVFAISQGDATNPGDVIISEFVFNPDTVPGFGNEWVELLNTTNAPINLDGWKLTEFNQPNDIEFSNEVTWSVLTGIIPANGILVFEVEGDNFDNSGDSIALFDVTPNLMYRVTYGPYLNAALQAQITPGLELTPGVPQATSTEGQSAIPDNVFSIFSPWSATGPPTKGWFNDAGQPGRPPLLSGRPDSILSFLNNAGINSNIGELDNPSATPAAEIDGALYFEKEGKGKIVFEETLNLSDQATVAVLQTLGEKMEMSDGHIAFDSATADSMAATGAKIYMYGLDILGYTSTPNLIVKDDNNLTIDGTDIIADVTYDPFTGELSFSAAHFTQFDADDNMYVSTTGSDDTGDGTQENPFQTIQKGIDSVPNDGTVNVAAGEYYENLDVAKNLTLLGDPGDENTGPAETAPIIYDNDCDRVINVRANDITIKGFVLEGDGCRPVIRIDQEIFGTTVSDNEIKNGRKGIDLSPYANANTITNNKIHDNDNEGVWIGGATDNAVSSNEIYNNGTGIGLGEGGCGSECVGDISGNEITDHNNIHNNYGSGIYVSGSNVSFNSLNISDNEITDNEGYGIGFSGVTIQNSELAIDGNTVTGNTSAGVYLSGRSGTISNSTVSLGGNTVNNNYNEGIYIDRIDFSSTLDVIKNTIRANGTDWVYPGVYINYVYDSSTVTFRDNTISDNTGQGVYACSEGECSSSTLTFQGNTIENNSYSGLEFYQLVSSTLNVFGNTVNGNGLSDSGAGFKLWYVGVGGGAPSTVSVSDNTFDSNYYGIYINQADGETTLKIGIDNIIENNGDAGIYLSNGVSTANIGGNTIQNNGLVSRNTGIVILGASGNEAHGNIISGNGDFGVSNQDEAGNIFNAKENWWGSSTGPTHSSNLGGKGNAVSDFVAFSKWCTNQECTEFGSNGPVDHLTVTASADSAVIPNPITITVEAQDIDNVRVVSGDNDTWTQVALTADNGALFVSGSLSLINGVNSTDISNTAASTVNVLASETPGTLTASKQITFTGGGGTGGASTGVGGGGTGGSSFVPSLSSLAKAKGDANNDGKTDILDFNLLMVNWGSTDTNNPADFNDDGIVDILDFNILMINWTL